MVFSAPAWAEEPAGVIFTIALKRDPPVYRIGERIELELSFSAKADGEYGIHATSERRATSLVNETYSIIPPDGATDPPENNHQNLRGGGGSFQSSYEPLLVKTVTRHAVLNEFLRFTKPGSYRLSATSPRTSHNGEPALAQSNEVALTIVSDPSWQTEELRQIRETLDSGGERRDAIAQLTYLDPAESSAEMARRFTATGGGGEDRAELASGLAQSSHPEAAIPILHAALLEPRGSAFPSIC